jgi:hypothetical protein
MVSGSFAFLKYSPYEIKVNGQVVEGALLTDGIGYSVLHPWTSLGDSSLSSLLRDLSADKKNPLVQRSLELLSLDAQARANDESLLPIQSPASHLFLDLRDALVFSKLKFALNEGIQFFKFKIGFDVDQEIAAFKKIQKEFALEKFKIRLDSNQRFKSSAPLFQLLDTFEDSFKSRIDFIEDPFAGIPEEWLYFKEKSSFRIAHDFASEEFRDLCDVWILKPTRNNPWPLVELALQKNKKLVFTSALDHELGQLAALSIADEVQKKYPLLVEDGGFLSFSELEGAGTHFLRKGNRLDFESLRGLGFGCESLLSALSWQDLRSQNG